MAYTRRALLRTLFYGAGAAAAVAWGLDRPSGYLPLSRVPGALPPLDKLPGRELPLVAGPLSQIGLLQNSGVDGIWIPEGFSVRCVARHLANPVSGRIDPSGGLLGYSWHRAPDGGAVFGAEDGGWVYVSNSETNRSGGVGALRFAADGSLIDAYPVLLNTRRNCAGGPTPWGTWLSCEELSDGLVYECDPFGTPAQAVVHPALGCFRHEAAAVDEQTRTVYLTEDHGDGRFYRFRSFGRVSGINGRSALDLSQGVLEVLEIDGFAHGGYDDNLASARVLRKVRWQPVLQPQHPQGEVRDQYRASTGQGAPGTRFNGGEGLWIQHFPDGQQPLLPDGQRPLRAVVFFACKGDNRVYALDIDNDQIEVVFDNEHLIGTGQAPFKDVDNLVVSPAGDVIVAEDGDAMRLMVMVPNGVPRILLQIDHGGSELTGPAFTPDGSRLYFSSQRGPSAMLVNRGATYELTLPPAFRPGSA
ncbi:alkaline phosphatase PhoX [Isoalcanivorax beigongshangi]|uniref:Alkaline phosphatase PhoX n=1 Tax=Isoalcanivorax beigongshangi TaxID=3238810 RepID=A0ABV4AFS6_9GAMM